MISPKMTSALNEQVNAELQSAYLYLSMSLDADAKSLRGIAHWFFIQFQEEQDHSRILQKYILSQSAAVELRPLDKVPTTWPTPMAMLTAALEQEQEVTRRINQLVRKASAEFDFATFGRLQWFVTEQVEEEESVRWLIDSFSRVSSHPELLAPLDSTLLSRRYSPAPPLASR